MKKVYVSAELLVKPEHSDEAKLLLTTLANNSLREQGCERYEILACSTDKNSFSTFELWSSSAAEKLHWQQPCLQSIVSQLGLLLQQPAVIKKFCQLQISMQSTI